MTHLHDFKIISQVGYISQNTMQTSHTEQWRNKTTKQNSLIKIFPVQSLITNFRVVHCIFANSVTKYFFI